MSNASLTQAVCFAFLHVGASSVQTKFDATLMMPFPQLLEIVRELVFSATSGAKALRA